jgi:hypothetical protein
MLILVIRLTSGQRKVINANVGEKNKDNPSVYKLTPHELSRWIRYH